eukprot:GHVS01008422.1.p1 GENE.GHVS01008422.1~~GHVS01008422.1.p1  ORF type:complete len:245 (-),score=5.62 GHVS01008422.1:342-1076(-)
MKSIQKRFPHIASRLHHIRLPEMHCVDVQNLCKGIQDYEKERQDNKKDVMEPSSEGAVGGEARDDGVSKAAAKTFCEPEEQKCFNPIYAEEMVWHLQSGRRSSPNRLLYMESVFVKWDRDTILVIGEEPNGVVYQVLKHGPQSLLVEVIPRKPVPVFRYLYLTPNLEKGKEEYETGDIQGQKLKIPKLSVFKFTEDDVKSAKVWPGGFVYVRVTYIADYALKIEHQTFELQIKIGPDIVLTIPL